MPAKRLPPTIIIRTVWVRLVASSSAYLFMTRNVAPANRSGQWQFSHVWRAGTRRPLSIAEGIGVRCDLVSVSTNWRTPETLLLTQPETPGVTWQLTHSTLEWGESWYAAN